MSLRNATVLGAISLSVLATACGGNVSAGSAGAAGAGANGGGAGTAGAGAGGGAGAAGTAGTGGAVPAGDCKTDADCNGSKCAEVTPGGFKVCLSFPGEATQCNNPGGPMDECCMSADCAAGKCYLSTDIPYCGGPEMAQYNRCVSDQCTDAADCVGDQAAICAPAGAFGQPVRVCLTAYCETSAECTAKPGGVCAPVSAPCCSSPAGLACVYPGGCRDDADCAADGSKHCEIDGATKTSVCKDGPANCPA